MEGKGKEKETLLSESIAQEVIETAETDIKILLAATASAAGNVIKMAALDGTCTDALDKLLELKWHGAFINKFHHFCKLHCLPLVGGIVSLVGGVISLCKGAYNLYNIINKQSMFRRVKDRVNREVGPLLSKMHYLLNNLLKEQDVPRSQKLQFVLYETCEKYEKLMLELETQLRDIQKGLTTSKWAVAATVIGLISGMASIAVSLFFFLAGPATMVIPAIMYSTGGGLMICGGVMTAGSQISKYLLKGSVDGTMKNLKPILFRSLQRNVLSNKDINFLSYLKQIQELARMFGTELDASNLKHEIEMEVDKVDRTRFCTNCPPMYFGPEFKMLPVLCGYCGFPFLQNEFTEEIQKNHPDDSRSSISFSVASTFDSSVGGSCMATPSSGPPG